LNNQHQGSPFDEGSLQWRKESHFPNADVSLRLRLRYLAIFEGKVKKRERDKEEERIGKVTERRRGKEEVTREEKMR